MSGFDVLNWTINGGTSGTPGAILVAAYSQVANDSVLEWNATGGAFAVTLLAPSAALAGRVVTLVQTTSTANQVTVKSAGGNINGTAGATGIAQTASKIGVGLAVCDGTNWFMELI